MRFYDVSYYTLIDLILKGSKDQFVRDKWTVGLKMKIGKKYTQIEIKNKFGRMSF